MMAILNQPRAFALHQWHTRPRLIAMSSGVLAATGFAPLNLWPLTLIGLAVLMASVRAAPNWRAAAGRGWFWGWGHFILCFNWIAHAFTFQDTMPHWLGWVAVVGLAAFLASYIALVCGASWLARGKPLPFALIFVACWIVSEYLRATLLTGFAWDPIGIVALFTGLRWAAPWLGTYALSGLLALISSLLLAQGMRARVLQAIGIGLLALWWQNTVVIVFDDRSLMYGFPLISIVQPNIPEDVGADPKQQFANLVKHLRLSGQPDPQHPRLILWPEGALTSFVEDEPWARQQLAAILGPRDILAAGGDGLVYDRPGHLSGAHNAIFLINAKAEIVGRYDKSHLVPGGEYLPLRSVLSVIGLNRLVPGDLDFLPGPGPRTLNVPGFGKMGGIICYEVIFSGEVVDRTNRPDFIFNPSTDAWFGAWGPPQHLAQARMRALEEGIPIIRSTTTGISAVINAQGVVESSLPLDTEGALISVIPPENSPTFFSRYGNLIPLVLAAILASIGLALMRRKA
jgi:apolipoprotein N-acyltransferase